MSTYQTVGCNRRLRQDSDLARTYAMEARWEEAVEVNQRILAEQSRDVEALNRLGKALSELRRNDEAIEAYQRSLEFDPGNAIATRNLNRLAQMIATDTAIPEFDPVPTRARAFVEETGKTYITDLVRPGSTTALLKVSPGDVVELRPSGNEVEVYEVAGERLGQLEPIIGQRLIALLGYGNSYQAFVVAFTGETIRVILRETSHNPEAPEQTSFPRQDKIAAPRPYVRDTALRARELENELLLDSDDDEGDNDDDESADAADNDEESDESEDEDEFGEEDSSTDDDEPAISN
ncbi:MAG TPA: tetratricopeptide repeat protein [Thermomicrobiaceae bacterium]|nr:tetratricopeptide repeat protein [Thermomicrobiaceae bacterium]